MWRFVRPVLAMAVLIGAISLSVAQAPQATDPKLAAAHTLFREGQQALREARHDRAAELFERSAELAPQVAMIHLHLAVARTERGDLDGALRAYAEVLKLEPENAAAYNGMGKVHHLLRDAGAALQAYRKALELDRTLIAAALNSGWIAKQLEQLEAAESAFVHCVSLSPRTELERVQQHKARFFLGTLRYRDRKFSSVAELMEQVLAKEPDHSQAHHYLGQAYMRLGRKEEGRRHLAQHKELLAAQETGGTMADADSR